MKKKKMRMKKKTRMKMRNLILIQEKNQKRKGVLRKRMMIRRTRTMRILTTTVSMNQEKLQKITQ